MSSVSCKQFLRRVVADAGAVHSAEYGISDNLLSFGGEIMDDRQFDGIARVIGQTTNRRQALRGLLGLAAGAVGLTVAGADAARRGYSGPGNTDSSAGTPRLEFAFNRAGGQCLVTLLVFNGPPNTRGTAKVYDVWGSLWFESPITTDSEGYALMNLRDVVPMRSNISAHVDLGDVHLDKPLTQVSC